MQREQCVGYSSASTCPKTPHRSPSHVAGRLRPELGSHHATAMCLAALQWWYALVRKTNQLNSLAVRKYEADTLGQGFVLLVLIQRNNTTE